MYMISPGAYENMYHHEMLRKFYQHQKQIAFFKANNAIEMVELKKKAIKSEVIKCQK